MRLSVTAYPGIGMICFFLLLFFQTISPAQEPDNNPHAVVLMYHRFGESKYPSTNITVEQFEAQLEYLKNQEFTVLSLDEIVEALISSSPLPDKTVAITVDDAYRSVYDTAYPRLRAMGFPFTVFLATGDVDKNIPAFMTWDQIHEMHDDGVLFANHTTDHEYLVRRKPDESHSQWLERVTMTIQNAQKRIVEELGSAPMLFAYPYGEYSTEIMELVSSLGYTGFGQHSGGISSTSDMRALPRFPMAEQFASISSFGIKVNALPLPVKNISPVNPVTSDQFPKLTITLLPGKYIVEQLACYNNNKAMKIDWLVQGEQFSIRSSSPLPPGRGRYNCTAPNSKGNRYYWFSHPWIVTGE